MKVILTLIKGKEQGRNFQFDRPDTFLVGRAKDCHLRLPSDDPYIARRHFLLEICPPRCVLKDFNSTNPPRVNGKIVSETELHHGDVIEVGYTLLRVDIEQTMRKVVCKKCGTAIPVSPDDVSPDLCSVCENAEAAKRRVVQKPSPTLTTWCAKCGKDVSERANSDGRVKELQGEVDYLCEDCYESGPAINGYTVIGNLGKGGMGIVNLVFHKKTGRLLALKKISKLSTPDLVKRFEREVRFTRDMIHENLIRYIDSGIHGREPYLVMQFVSGGNLEDMLIRRGKPFDAREAVYYVAGVLSGLEVMHGNKMIHRDIKPQNILVKKLSSGRIIPKITDLGLAKKYAESGGSLLTQRDTAMGTILYMPPEQIRDAKSVRETADLYSVGVTLYYLLTGRFPYNFPTQFEVQELRDRLHMGKSLGEVLMLIVGDKKLSPMHIILTEDPIPVIDRNLAISEKLAKVVDKAVRKEPEARYQAADEFRKDILAAV